ncbi:ATP-dependent RNA helicase, putative [Ricinus communis]|uniref:RNA helicase n=1 Tax=Ricinus communis TaxID=3988 RepID=B9RUH0_RICCO|nr:ATP-dependent RNA helicase, putative [Ricinus communis]
MGAGIRGIGKRSGEPKALIRENGSGKTTQIPQYLHESGFTKTVELVVHSHRGLLQECCCQGVYGRTGPAYSVIMVDEAQERMKFSDYFDSAPILTVLGRQHPADILYKQPVKDYLEEAIAATLHVHVTQPPGDILVFITGQEDIENAEEILKQKMRHYGSKIAELVICPIFANLPTELQARI